MSQIDKQAIITEHKRHDADSGSSEVQIAILSKKITHLTEHLKINKQDHSSRFGLIKMVNKRRKLLDYLKRTDNEKYQSLLKKLGIRR
ncbi:MAG: 30S ribosomal protein S15 [Kiritimatiellae bacterium]|jgi:small subunit ribosomal protein S15|nr:30S ribosomal protein S15 [Kiritimatiellia bacterium]